jgi:hypothetical protein
MWTSGSSITNSDDTIDSRDVIARIKELEEEREGLEEAVKDTRNAYRRAHSAWKKAAEGQSALLREDTEEDVDSARETLVAAREELKDWDGFDDGGEELTKLKEFAEEAEGYTSEWEDGAYFIRETYFEDHAQEEAESCGLMENCTGWPARHIDWEAAANELKQDYCCIEFDGEDYYVRSC